MRRVMLLAVLGGAALPACSSSTGGAEGDAMEPQDMAGSGAAAGSGSAEAGSGMAAGEGPGDGGAGAPDAGPSTGSGGSGPDGGEPSDSDPTYTVRMLGALIAPFDEQGVPWDGTGTALQSIQDELDTAKLDYESAQRFVTDAASDWDPPEVYGEARLSSEAYPEAEVTLEPAGSTFWPQWDGAGWKHVRLVDSLRVLISLYDDDAATPDAISYVLLDTRDLEAAAEMDGPAVLAAYDRTGSRTLWIELEITAEEHAAAAGFAPAALADPDVDRDPALEELAAKQTTLWIHGLDFNGGSDVVIPWGDPYYWTKDGVDPTGPNPEVINYHARAYLNLSNVVILYALERYCLGERSCVLACHSAGCAQVGYTLAELGAQGTRWLVDRVIGGGSAAGGSELADLGSFTGIAGFLGNDLRVQRMRDLYDHDALGVQVDLSAGAAGGPQASLLPGEDDGSVAYHSAGGARQALAYANVGCLICDAVLPYDTFDDDVFYFDHRVVYRDDAAAYSHAEIKAQVAEWVDSEFPAP